VEAAMANCGTGLARIENLATMVMAELTKNPTGDYAQLTMSICGCVDPDRQKRIRSMVRYLRTQGRLRQRDDGAWEVVIMRP
jgi:hypothetical protein